MSASIAPSRALRASRYICQQCQSARQLQRRSYVATTEESRLPRVANPSFWASLVPRFLRKPTTVEEAVERARVRDAGAEERRVGITFLVLGILVGSNAINIIATRREMLNFTRQTDAKLELLREVVQRVKNGEDVDVKKALGTGDPTHEKEWEQVMEELENTDMLWEGRKKREAKRAEKAEERRLKDEERKASKSSHDTQSTDAAGQEAQDKPTPKFLM